MSVLSHRCVTSSEVKTAGFRRSVLTFLNISGCSERKNRMLKLHHIKECFFFILVVLHAVSSQSSCAADGPSCMSASSGCL